MKNNKQLYMAVDQYGQTFFGLKHPRKELCKKLGTKHAEKMYVNDKAGKTFHVGYVIAGLWLKLYIVEPLRKEA